MAADIPVTPCPFCTYSYVDYTGFALRCGGCGVEMPEQGHEELPDLLIRWGRWPKRWKDGLPGEGST